MNLNIKKKKIKPLIIILIILICLPITVLIGLKIWIDVAVMPIFDTTIGTAQYYKGRPEKLNNHYNNIINELNKKTSSNENMKSDSWFDIYTSDIPESHFLYKDLYLVYVDKAKKQPLFLINNGENLNSNSKYTLRFYASTKIVENIYVIMIDGYCDHNNWVTEIICEDSNCYETATVQYNKKNYCDKHYDEITFVKCSKIDCSQRGEKEFTDPFSKTRKSHIYCTEHYFSTKKQMDNLYPCVLSGYNCDETGEKYIIDHLTFDSIKDGVTTGSLGFGSYYCKNHFEKELSKYGESNVCYYADCQNKPTYLLLIENNILTINGSSVNALRKTCSDDDLTIIDETIESLNELCSCTFVSCENHYNDVLSIFTDNSAFDIFNAREYQKTHPNTSYEEKCCISGCNSKATHVTKGIFNSSEYYCDKHYLELNDLLDFFKDESDKLGISDEVDFNQYR